MNNNKYEDIVIKGGGNTNCQMRIYCVQIYLGSQILWNLVCNLCRIGMYHYKCFYGNLKGYNFWKFYNFSIGN